MRELENQNRNLLLAAGLSFGLIAIWTLLFPYEQAEQTVEPQTDPIVEPKITEILESPELPRIQIRTPSLSGSMSLVGGRIDDLYLRDYRDTIDPESANVRLLRPTNASNGYYAVYGWVPAAQGHATPGPNTKWKLLQGSELTPNTPITLGWENQNGLVFEREIHVDSQFVFEIIQRVHNHSPHPVSLIPYGIIARHGDPDSSGFSLLNAGGIIHEGAMGVLDDSLIELDYDDLKDLDPIRAERGPAQHIQVQNHGWLGFTDKYWMTAMIPNGNFSAVFKSPEGRDLYQADYRLPMVTVLAGETTESTTHLFSGAKEVATLRRYQESLQISRFEDAIDWGWLFFLTKPMFWLLHSINTQINNMGYSIITLTLIFKLALFPLGYKSYTMMARMKKLQPEMVKIKERANNNWTSMQQEMIALYKKEKVNPAGGCLPILLQIPIFFSLYKVISVTIELRHAPFIGWIQDLSAPDPTSVFNLFGLVPWTPPEFLGIGFWPVLMGVTMWLQMQMNPTPPDPFQKKIFTWMPVFFTFMLGHFPAGLVIYWTANSVFSGVQQFIVMRMHRDSKPST